MSNRLIENFTISSEDEPWKMDSIFKLIILFYNLYIFKVVSLLWKFGVSTNACIVNI